MLTNVKYNWIFMCILHTPPQTPTRSISLSALCDGAIWLVLRQEDQVGFAGRTICILNNCIPDMKKKRYLQLTLELA